MATQIKQHPAPEIVERAADWACRFSLGEISSAEQTEFKAWLNSDTQHELAFNDACAILNAGERLTVADDRLLSDGISFSSKLQENRPSSHLSVLQSGLDWRIAAAGVLGLIASLFVLSSDHEVHMDVPSHETLVAQIDEILLDDGTHVTLGPMTELTVMFEPGERRVALSAGEAFFSVASNPDRPFVVQTQDAEIRVVGTAFNINQGPTGTRVSVSEGVVEVFGKGVFPIPVPNFMAAKRQLTPGDEVVSKSGHLADLTYVQPEQAGVWRSGWLVYANRPLADVIADANRYSAVPIEIADNELHGMKVVASFRSDSIDDLISGLQLNLPLRIDRTDPNVIVLRSRSG